MNRARALHHVTSPHANVLVVGCGLTRHQRAYVVDGLRWSAECRFIDTFDELERGLASLTRCDALILSPEDHRGRSAAATVERAAREWPDTAIVIFSPARSQATSSLQALVLAGAHRFVFEGVADTAAALADAVENARRETAAERAFVGLQELVPAQLHPMVHAIVSRPETVTSVLALAAAMGVHRKTLVNRCVRSGFLPPAELIMWCRLAMVGHFLERSGSTVESIGLTLGFASHTALRNLVKRYTGHRATEIRERGGLCVVVAALARRLEAARARHPERSEGSAVRLPVA